MLALLKYDKGNIEILGEKIKPGRQFHRIFLDETQTADHLILILIQSLIGWLWERKNRTHVHS